MKRIDRFPRWRLCAVLAVALLLTLSLRTAAQTQTVRFAVWGGAQELKIYQDIIERFEAQHPNIKVELEYPGEFAAYFERLQVQLLAGTAPDVMRMSGAYFGSLAAQNTFLDLTPLIERDGMDIEELFFDTLGIFDYEGRRYALPQGGDITGLFYNKDILTEAGVTEPDGTWTWEDLYENGRRLTVDRDGDGTPDRYGFHLVANNTQWGWFNFVLQAGVTPLTADKKRSQLDRPEAIEAFEFIERLHAGGVSPRPGVLPVFDTFAPEYSAMTTRLVPAQFPYWETLPFEWDIAPLPKGKRMASQANWIGWTISRTTSVPDAAWEFTRFLATEGAWLIAEHRQMIPGLLDAAFSDVFLASGSHPYRVEEVLLATTPYTYDLQFTPSWSRWTAAVNQEVNRMVLGEQSPVQTAERAAQAVNAILADER